MKNIFPLLILFLAGTMFGQTAEQGTGEMPSVAKWNRLAGATEGPDGVTMFSRFIRANKAGQFQFSLKVVPQDKAAFVKRHKLPGDVGYIVQYATVDCAKKMLSFERTTLYGEEGYLIKSDAMSLFPSDRRGRVARGSIGDLIYKNICTNELSK